MLLRKVGVNLQDVCDTGMGSGILYCGETGIRRPTSVIVVGQMFGKEDMRRCIHIHEATTGIGYLMKRRGCRIHICKTVVKEMVNKQGVFKLKKRERVNV